MTFFGMALLTAAGTIVLALFAIITAWYARKAFLKQSQEVSAIERQVADEQELTRQQGELLKVQTGQLEVLRAQLEDQQKASAAQAEVLKLQADDLRESLEERERQADDRRRSQAAKVNAWLKHNGEQRKRWGAHIHNASDLPIFDVRVFFYLPARAGEVTWVPASIGGPDEAIPVLPPQSEGFVLMLEGDVSSVIENIDVSERSCVVGVEFTDSAGNRWERNPRGALNPLS